MDPLKTYALPSKDYNHKHVSSFVSYANPSLENPRSHLNAYLMPGGVVLVLEYGDAAEASVAAYLAAWNLSFKFPKGVLTYQAWSKQQLAHSWNRADFRSVILMDHFLAGTRVDAPFIVCATALAPANPKKVLPIYTNMVPRAHPVITAALRIIEAPLLTSIAAPPPILNPNPQRVVIVVDPPAQANTAPPGHAHSASVQANGGPPAQVHRAPVQTNTVPPVNIKIDARVDSEQKQEEDSQTNELGVSQPHVKMRDVEEQDIEMRDEEEPKIKKEERD